MIGMQDSRRGEIPFSLPRVELHTKRALEQISSRCLELQLKLSSYTELDE